MRCAVCWVRRAVVHIAGEGRCAKHAPAWAHPKPPAGPDRPTALAIGYAALLIAGWLIVWTLR